ncbi:transglutaminase-like cysteine peptidase [Ideonella sp.]|uniref:transglutaminase-like cysteine peptidase n=1 Tax=Ideonella sp. TaxID=1929293 RepID=UPI002B492302|nr:transglutaminase-like cysteine peptidase [Ideonella sp.]HJV69318.1 transglutaminase-like cysteine peptidase [Ideonella sp.]
MPCSFDAIRPSARAVRRWLLGAAILLAWPLEMNAWSPSRIVQAAARHGAQALREAEALRMVMAAARTQGERGRIDAINTFYNRHLRYGDDMDTWGEVDYWASPLEALQRGLADCEDYAIAKYVTLAAVGVPQRKLRMVYVRLIKAATPDVPGGLVQPHMVLAYYPSPDAEPLLLDNLVDEVVQVDARPELQPVFSFNTEGLWEGVGRVEIAGAGPVERLSRWRDALSKARLDGFLL